MNRHCKNRPIGSQPILEIEKIPEPNEYIINADKILAFTRCLRCTMKEMYESLSTRPTSSISHIVLEHSENVNFVFIMPHIKFEGHVEQRAILPPSGIVGQIQGITNYPLSYKN